MIEHDVTPDLAPGSEIQPDVSGRPEGPPDRDLGGPEPGDGVAPAGDVGPADAGPADVGPADAEPPGTQPSKPDPPELTGVPEVDSVLSRLQDLDDVPVSDHVEAYEAAHRQLHEALLAASEDHVSEDPTGAVAAADDAAP